MKNLNKNEFDNKFKDRFQDFEVKPSDNNWKKIDKKMEDNWFDATFSNVLSNKEQQPQASNWTVIEKRLQDRPVLRAIQQVSKVAAVLLLGLLVFQFFSSDILQEKELAQAPLIQSKEVLADQLTAPEDNTFIIEVVVPEEEEPVKKILSEKEEIDMDALMASILEDDDDLRPNMDLPMLKRSIEPLERPSLETFAMLPPRPLNKQLIPQQQQVPDIKIMIPLKIELKE